MGKAECEGKEQEPGELHFQLRQCSGWQGTAGLGKAQGQIHCLSGTSRMGQWLPIPLAAQFLHPWLFLDISITPRREELEHITPHTREKGFSARLVWDNKRFSRCNLICAPGPLPSRGSVPSLWWHHSIPSQGFQVSGEGSSAQQGHPGHPAQEGHCQGRARLGSGSGAGWISVGNGD